MASPSPFSFPEVLTQKLALLRALADSLQQAQSALATATPAQLDQQTARQGELCRQLRALPTPFQSSQPEAHFKLAGELQETARRVGELNRKYAALLRRRRRTVDIFCRVLATSGTTYPAPRLVSRPHSEPARTKG
jgi:hypothetical protein